MLTGESIPVFKTPLKEEELSKGFDKVPDKRILFNGTKLIRARPSVNQEGQQEPTLAMVYKTGFATIKGNLIRSILFPRPNTFKFYQDAFKFLAFLSVIAFIGFCFTLFMFIRMKVDLSVIVIRSLDMITIVVPPALPAAMSIGITFAIERLKRSKIFCISPSRVNICGKLNIFVFDKTGTLTEEGLDIMGIQENIINENKEAVLLELQNESIPTTTAATTSQNLLNLNDLMATCHSIKSVDGELIGDPLDLKMFEFTNRVLEEEAYGNFSTIVRPSIASQSPSIFDPNELGIIRCFEFLPSLRRMSTIVKKLQGNLLCAFVKGAPEVIKSLCHPETIPHEFDEFLNFHSRNGHRVIACAGKSLDSLSWAKVQKMQREEVESDLTFLGFIIFENKLKPQTKPVLDVLSRAQIRDVMCTGDNLMTALSVGKECGLIEKDSPVFIPRIINQQVQWESMDDPSILLDPYTLKPLSASHVEALHFKLRKQSSQHSSVSSFGDPDAIKLPQLKRRHSTQIEAEDLEQGHRSHTSAVHYDLAITGEVFDFILENYPKETIEKLLIKTEIFARMSPDQKLSLIEQLQLMGYCVGMCGDGANDCSALKTADVGISLSEAEASVAAPFTSLTPSIECVLVAIREGRCALVTSFSCFKFIALYSMIQFISVSLLYTMISTLGDFQFLYIDLFLIIPMATFMSRTEALFAIHYKRPTANLVSKKVLLSLIGQIFIQIFFQALLFLNVRRQNWYHPTPVETDEATIVSFENSVVWLISCFQYLIVAIVFSVGHPFRKEIYQNFGFMMTLFILFIYTLVLTLFPDPWSFKVFQLEDIPMGYRQFIVFMAILNFITSFLGEKYIFPKLSEWLSLVMYKKESERRRNFLFRLLERVGWRKPKKNRKRFKLVKEEFEHS